MKKAIIILAGIAVLASGGYAAGQIISKKKNEGNFVQFEDGRRMRIENLGQREPAQIGERPALTGRIKSVGENLIVIEKFEMPNGAGQGRRNIQDGQYEGPQDSNSERPQPVVSGESTIVLADDVSIVKGAGGFMGRRSGGENAEQEEASTDELKEGALVTIWLKEGAEAETAQRIMIRAN